MDGMSGSASNERTLDTIVDDVVTTIHSGGPVNRSDAENAAHILEHGIAKEIENPDKSAQAIERLDLLQSKGKLISDWLRDNK